MQISKCQSRSQLKLRLECLVWIAEAKYDESARRRIIRVCREFAEIVQPIANKYLD
jgi:hypothetical protein